jgi:hypothetical protein
VRGVDALVGAAVPFFGRPRFFFGSWSAIDDKESKRANYQLNYFCSFLSCAISLNFCSFLLEPGPNKKEYFFH